ncbi:SIR2 family protein [Panacagrimonas sp.]|uniref:SIR2 family protein n=1 Tax=Panacagrimonas sp. TaxID=2480088 RepID=UPI003B52DC85
MIRTLKGPEFARQFALRPQMLAWFLGAGASASAGIPTGYAMITDLKKRLFCQLTGTSLRQVDANDPLWIARINSYLSTRSGLPVPNDPTEYAAAFEAVYPTPEDRRAYIEAAIRKGSPSFAHRVLAALLTTQRVPCVFTTNFDSLIETAATLTDQLVDPAERAHLTVAAIDNAARAQLCMRESRWPLLAKLHGDYQSVELKNTTAELKTQDSQMRQVLSAACARFGLVVVGYSGRDASVMEALTEALAQPKAFPGGLFWVTRRADSLLPAVTQLLEAAVKAGVSVAVVDSQTFDELAADIADDTELPAPLKTHVYQARPNPVVREVPLPTTERRKFPVLQCSALPVLALPTVARRIQVDQPVSTSRARELLREAEVWAIVASAGQELAAFGSDADLDRAFASVGGRVAGSIELHPERDSWARGLLYDALVRALCRRRPLFARLRRKGHSLLVQSGFPDDPPEVVTRRDNQLAELKRAYNAALVGKIPDLDYPFNEGVQIRLESLNGQWWCAFEPFTSVEFPRREADNDGDAEAASGDLTFQVLRQGDPAIDWRRERWVLRRNQAWAQIIAAWARILAGDGSFSLRSLRLEDGVGQDAEFRLSPVTAWSRPGHEHDYFRRGGR